MKMLDWPADDAPLAEWLRPVSATLRNMRSPEDQFEKDEGRYGYLGGVVVKQGAAEAPA